MMRHLAYFLEWARLNPEPVDAVIIALLFLLAVYLCRDG